MRYSLLIQSPSAPIAVLSLINTILHPKLFLFNNNFSDAFSLIFDQQSGSYSTPSLGSQHVQPLQDQSGQKLDYSLSGLDGNIEALSHFNDTSISDIFDLLSVQIQIIPQMLSCIQGTLNACLELCLREWGWLNQGQSNANINITVQPSSDAAGSIVVFLARCFTHSNDVLMQNIAWFGSVPIVYPSTVSQSPFQQQQAPSFHPLCLLGRSLTSVIQSHQPSSKNQTQQHSSIRSPTSRRLVALCLLALVQNQIVSSDKPTQLLLLQTAINIAKEETSSANSNISLIQDESEGDDYEDDDMNNNRVIIPSTSLVAQRETDLMKVDPALTINLQEQCQKIIGGSTGVSQ
ncbi:MAG: hypothetical protein EZS28_012552 [Streblomastix strix]|nr:MAG: hypothetical protein EZS28_012552 [Streblomastix strix]